MKITMCARAPLSGVARTVPLPPHFCTNPMDVIQPTVASKGGAASMATFTFHGWVLVEIETDAGLVGIGNAALSPQITKQVIDLYLKPLLVGQDPWDVELLWQHMYRKTMAFGARALRWWRSRRWILRCGTFWARRPSSRCIACSAADEGQDSGVCQPALCDASG